MRILCSTAFVCSLLVSGSNANDVEDVIDLQQRAVRAAVATVSDSVIQIETLGGLESTNALVSAGPTTGLIVSKDGYIVSSAFSFAQNPDSILVTLPNGTKQSATIVAQDRSRMTVLLKVETKTDLPVPTTCARDDLRAGQTVVAVGRTYSKSDVSLSVGIISATNRIWGRAVQTDANISPANYGGPLIDLHGRVIGVLVPLSPQPEDEMAGAEWYDSGIGFAVPLTDILRKLPEWKTGKDLSPGRMGVTLDAEGLDPPPKIKVVKINSPAASAGLKPNDRVVSINGQPVKRLSQLRHALGPLYAFERVQLEIERDGEQLDFDLELIDKVPPYEHAFLGVLPIRKPSPDDSGVIIRHLFPNSPAAEAGLLVGDTLLSIGEEKTPDQQSLRLALANLQPGETTSIEWKRGESTDNTEVVLVGLPESIPDKLPEAVEPEDDPERETGKIDFGTPEDPNECTAYVPESLGGPNEGGLLVVLNSPESIDIDQTLADWKDVCDERGIVLIVPQPEDPTRWQRQESDFVRKVIDRAKKKYELDDQRIGIFGIEAGGRLAFLTGLRHRDVVRAVAVLDAALPGRLNSVENEPLQRLAMLFATSPGSDDGAEMKDNAQAFREAKFPVTELSEPAESGRLKDSQRFDVGRWLDSLDRL